MLYEVIKKDMVRYVNHQIDNAGPTFDKIIASAIESTRLQVANAAEISEGDRRMLINRATAEIKAAVNSVLKGGI